MKTAGSRSHLDCFAGNLILDDESSPFASEVGDYQVIIKSIVSSNSLTASGTALSPSDLNNIIAGVWDEAIAGHTTFGSVAKILKDIKLKATIASLK